MKENTDDSKRGDNTTEGGVFRDESGSFIFGFCTKFSHNDSLRAELESILEGTMACKQIDGYNVVYFGDGFKFSIYHDS